MIKKFTQLLFCLILFSDISAQDTARVRPGAASPKIFIRCGVSASSSTQPLYVVDGVIWESIGDLKSDDIESIHILKTLESAAIYGTPARNGCVIITTKLRHPRIFIKDVESGSPVPMASCKVFYARDSVMLVADENGMVELKNLKGNPVVKMEVSAISHEAKTQLIDLSKTKSFEIYLKRESRKLGEVVVVTSYRGCVLRRISFCGGTSKKLVQVDEETYNEVKGTALKIFPNPQLRGNTITIELPGSFVEGKLIVTDVSGKRVHSQDLKNIRRTTLVLPTGSNWSAGTYFVNVYSSNGKKSSAKLILQ